MSESVPPELYNNFPKLDVSVYDRNPVFLVYGDNRPSYRAYEKLVFSKNNWSKQKLLIFPIYAPWLILNDLYGSINYFRGTPVFGRDESRAVLTQLYAEIENNNIDFIAHTGDIVTNGSYASHWEYFLRETGIEIPVLQRVPIYPAAGNHDYPNHKEYGEANFNRVFPNSKFYTKRFKDILLIFIDSTIILDQDGHLGSRDEQDRLFRKWFVSQAGSAEASWLEQKLESSNEKYKIIFMHHPLISFGKHSGDWRRDNWGNNISGKRDEIFKVLKKNHVNAIFAGHEHYYEHNLLSYEEEEISYQMHIVITGGGGTPVRPLTSNESVMEKIKIEQNMGYNVQMLKREEAYNYCVVTVTENGIEVIVKSVNGRNADSTGIIEQFKIF
ncbi:MAG: metallophosphoesterase [Candidatus Marinimicrobia bacterium]|nr:metallophosphoesterase [Candidatus Neomarinimicrobiota bacterium]